MNSFFILSGPVLLLFLSDFIACFFSFFNCYLAVLRPTLDHSRGDSFTNPMLIIAFVLFRPEGHGELVIRLCP